MPKAIFSIGEVLRNSENFITLMNRVNEFDAVDKFAEIFPELKSIAQAIKVSKEVLFLRVENSVWRSELKLREKLLLKKLNKHLNDIKIKSIKFI